MNFLTVFFQTIGGLGIFILGMKTMTDGLKMSSGKTIKTILGKMSSNRFVGCLTGAGVTAMVQSSSATTVMLIGFVGAGMITLQQAVGVILGANIGTTVTAQLIAFKLSKIALPAIAIGVALKIFSRKKRVRYIGDIILGFGLVFFGMTIMKDGLAPIKKSAEFIAFFTKFNPDTIGGILLCVSMGAILTIMVQSSSATVGLTMALAVQGLLDFPTATALVLGENIGTTITAELATIGSDNIDAHRAARAHTMFNVIGVLFIIIFFNKFVFLIELITQKIGVGPPNQASNGEFINLPRYIANAHTIFNILNAMFFLFVLPWLIKVAIFLSPKPSKEEHSFKLPQFDNRFMDSTIAAVANAQSEITTMMKAALNALENVFNNQKENNLNKLNNYKRYEDYLDSMQKEIISYLTTIYQGDVNNTEAKDISNLIRITNNIERIGDEIEKIAFRYIDQIEYKITLSDDAIRNIDELYSVVKEFTELNVSYLSKRKTWNLQEAERIENKIDALREEMRGEHINRLRKGKCVVDGGLMFIAIISSLEKIGDYNFSIAKSLS